MGVIAVGGAWGKDIEWSFSDHPFPRKFQLTEGERDALAAPHNPGALYIENCELELKIGFDIYKSRYPRFAEIGDKENRFSAWKRHIVEQSKSGLQYCVVDLPFVRFIELFYWGDLIYCGQFSREPETSVEHERVQALSEIIDYARLGKPSALSVLLILNGPDGKVRLNPDLEYYMRRLFKKLGVYDDEWDTAHLEPALSPQRQAFVEAAVEREDFAAVLDTTEPCRTSHTEAAQ